MRDELLCAEIFRQVVRAVQIPVTVKMRTGWDHLSKNGPRLQKWPKTLAFKRLQCMEERVVICTKAMPNTTHSTYAEAVQIPLIANGDITSIQKAREVLSATGADAVMIGAELKATRGYRGSSPLNSMVDRYLDRRRRSNRDHGQTHPRDSIVLWRKNGRQNGT